jgi:discoidin domain receptor family protein 2
MMRILLDQKLVGKIFSTNECIYTSYLLFRARTEQYGGAWCPLNDIRSIPNEWLEIDFGNLTYLTQVETQGRFDNGRGKEYADYYVLMYTRSDNELSWIEYKPKNKDQNSTWIRANQNTYMGEIRQLGQ